MSLALAIATGDKTQLPSRRDEAWRWSDLEQWSATRAADHH